MKKNLKAKVYRLLYICFAVTIACNIIVVFGFAFPSTYNSGLKTGEELTNQTLLRINEYLHNINSLGVQISYNSFTREILENPYDDKVENQMTYFSDSARMSLLYQDFVFAFNGITGIFIYNQYGLPYFFTTENRINRDYDITTTDWYQALNDDKVSTSEVLVSGMEYPPQISGSTYYICLYRNIRNLKNHKIIGQAEIMVRPRALEDILKSALANHTTGQSLTLIDQDGKVICSTKNYDPGDTYDEKLLKKIQGTSHITVSTLTNSITSYSSDYSNWYLIGEFDSSQLLKSIYPILLLFIASVALSLGLVIVLGNRMTKQITQPIAQLSDGISNVKNGNFDLKINLHSNDEFEDLAMVFNQMSDAIKKYIQQIQEIAEQKNEAQMAALQAQINPHFTLNTINSVKHMAILSGSSNIVSMLNDFELLLAAAFRHPNELITLREEMERIQAFTRIQSISSFGKIKFVFSYDEEVLDYLTLGLILQPIVENAVFHGIKSKFTEHQLQSGTIAIRIETGESDILIHVTDDGIGMTQEKIDDILSGHGSRIGITNVNTRIQLRFKGDYGLRIKSAPGEGCDVCIHIPKIKEQ